MHQIVYNLIRKRKWLNDFIVFSKFFTWVRSNIQRIYSNTFLKLCTQWAKNVEKKSSFLQDKLNLLCDFPLFWGCYGTIFSYLKEIKKSCAKNLPPFLQYTILSPFPLLKSAGEFIIFFRKPWFSKYYILSHVLTYW